MPNPDRLTGPTAPELARLARDLFQKRQKALLAKGLWRIVNESCMRGLAWLAQSRGGGARAFRFRARWLHHGYPPPGDGLLE